MSILVKDMVMPTNCMDCFFHKKDEHFMRGDEECDYKVRVVYNCIFKPDEIEDGWVDFDTALKRRQEWCPLKAIKCGHWIEHKADPCGGRGCDTKECSVCNAEQRYLLDDNYCPNCGAIMRRQKNENND